MNGTIKALKPGGFGFIQPDGGGEDLFFHVRDLARGTLEEQLGFDVRVAFTVRQGDKGPMASKVRVLEGGELPAVSARQYSVDDCIEGLKQSFLAGLEWLDLLEAALKDQR